MRIAIAHPHVWPEVRRGAERYADDLAAYLRARGHDVELLAGTTGPSGVEERPDGTVVRRRHHRGMAKLGRLGVDPVQAFGLTIAGDLRQRYDVVHALVPSAAIAARLAGAPTVFTFIGHPTADQLAGRRLERVLHAGASRAATVTTALSHASADSTEALFGRRPDVLPPGVRVDDFADPTGAAHPTSQLLFSAAPGDRRKGLDLLLLALALLLPRRPDVRLVVSGQGDPGWAFDALGSRRAHVAAAVDLVGAGAPEDVPVRYRAAAVTVLPAVHEAFGLSLVESLACGTPVVCTRDGGMVDIVDRPEVGRTFPRGDAEALAAALDEALDLAADPATPAACAAHARRWDWDAVVGPLHEAAYEQAVSARARRR